ncbi:hypothetical protein P154DRAFT_622504 [Amniculicola lignicola CBS 123094]|uniref:Uncharacterized protein n=1 Tax=Amniculicola lignicola CBS 123094 TaxID=1392246 RepID=A0A6A5W8B3_9PLEO|nr:hypothetical protein P154DRAFT_622504 [Amniculicola lignicola CBS 123094]
MAALRVRWWQMEARVEKLRDEIKSVDAQVEDPGLGQSIPSQNSFVQAFVAAARRVLPSLFFPTVRGFALVHGAMGGPKRTTPYSAVPIFSHANTFQQPHRLFVITRVLGVFRRKKHLEMCVCVCGTADERPTADIHVPDLPSQLQPVFVKS